MGDAPGAARFLGLGADMNLGFGKFTLPERGRMRVWEPGRLLDA